MARAQWQPDTKKKTAALMVEARNKGWSDSRIKDQFMSMGMDLEQMAGYGTNPDFTPFKQGDKYYVPPAKRFNYNMGGTNKRNQLQIAQESDKSTQSYSGQMNQSNLQDAFGNKNLYSMGSGIFGYEDDPGKKKDETSWWSDIGEQLGSEGFLGGVKGWLDLGVKGMEAYTGFQQVGIAREQNQMARQNLAFQQDAWGKDYSARRIAYNQNARDLQKWKDAQTPGGYAMSELVPA